MENADDAGVYKLTDDWALIQTVDFFTPIADDPYVFGQIAAANALSDVYAMGGKPLTAMNLVCFPVKDLDIEILQKTLAGGLDKIREAEAVLVGGHSVADKEFKYGLSVTGIVHPDRVLTNRGARPGDALVLTKPLGTGVVATAVKADLATPEASAAITDSMVCLNRVAAECLQNFEVNACTDVTGFGLIGHLAEMVEGTDVGAVVHAWKVPLFPDVEEFCNQGLLPGGLHRNRTFREKMVDMGSYLPQYLQDVLFDPQTSGGLLIAVASSQAEHLVDRLNREGIGASGIIGEFADRVDRLKHKNIQLNQIIDEEDERIDGRIIVA
jgi:selenide,water dikinase